MSYPGVDPTDVKETNPVETQEHSVGVKELPEVEPFEFEMPDDQPEPPTQEEKDKLNEVVKAAFSDMFQVTEPWKARKVVKFVIDCPSGQKVLVKHMDVLDLAAAGLVEDMDLFTKKLFPSSFDDQGNPVKSKEESLWKALEDIKKRLQFLQMTNKLMASSAVEPSVVDDGVAIRTNEETAQQEIVFGHEVKDIDEQLKLFGKPVPPLGDRQGYAGAINFNDRMTFFTELQKPLGLIEPFRERQDAVLASLESGPRVGDTAQ